MEERQCSAHAPCRLMEHHSTKWCPAHRIPPLTPDCGCNKPVAQGATLPWQPAAATWMLPISYIHWSRCIEHIYDLLRVSLLTASLHSHGNKRLSMLGSPSSFSGAATCGSENQNR